MATKPIPDVVMASAVKAVHDAGWGDEYGDGNYAGIINAALPFLVPVIERDLIERMIEDAGEKTTIFHPDTQNRISLFESHRERLANWLSSYLPTEDTDHDE